MAGPLKTGERNKERKVSTEGRVQGVDRDFVSVSGTVSEGRGEGEEREGSPGRSGPDREPSGREGPDGHPLRPS